MFQRCRREFYWQAVLHMERLKRQDARDFGSLYHLGLEAWWNHAGVGVTPWDKEPSFVPLIEAVGAIRAGGFHVETDKYDVAAAEAMITGYHARWSTLEYELIGGGTEIAFEIPLRDPAGVEVPGWTLVGRKDGLASFDGIAKVVEHKHTKSDIRPGTDYWRKLDMDMQPSAYVDAAVAGGVDVRSVLYDVSKRPQLTPKRKTPEEDLEYTKGSGCKVCGGTASGDVKKGAGVCALDQATAFENNKRKVTATEGGDALVTCPACKGSGWKDEPHLTAKCNLEDEPVEDYKARVLAAVSRDPESSYKQVDVPRRDAELSEARADMVAATVEIDALYARARAVAPAGNLRTKEARRVFGRNTSSCQKFGRPCDWIEVCQLRVNPYESKLYRIKPKAEAAP